jgi:hypothetical protein
MIGIAVVAALLQVADGSTAPQRPAARINVVAHGVNPIRRSSHSAEGPLLLIYVVDQDGHPLEGAAASVFRGRGIEAESSTAADGRAMIRLSSPGLLSVRVDLAGFIRAEAWKVITIGGGLTAVVLPLELVEPKR